MGSDSIPKDLDDWAQISVSSEIEHAITLVGRKTGEHYLGGSI